MTRLIKKPLIAAKQYGATVTVPDGTHGLIRSMLYLLCFVIFQ